MVVRKKQIITATLALALGAAVFVNWYYSRPQVISTLDGDTSTSVQDNGHLGDAQYVAATAADGKNQTLDDFKIKRDAAEDKAKETLNSVIKDSKSDPAAVNKATEALKILSDDIKDERDLESLISAKLGGDNIVIIDDDICQVIVEKGKLNSNTTLQIKDLVVKQAKIPSKNITIIELKG